MKKIVAVLLFSVVFNFFGQEVELPNLIDSTKHYWFSDTEKALCFANLALAVCDTADYAMMGECLKNKGVVFYVNRNTDSAEFYYFQALKKFEHGNFKSGTQKVLNNLGVLYMENRQLDKSVEMYIEAHNLAVELADTVAILRGLNNISNVYVELRNYRKSLEYLLLAEPFLNSNTDEHTRAQVLGNMFSSYRYVGDFENFRIYSRRTLEIYKKLNDSIGIANTYTNIANGYEQFNRFDSCIILNKRALDVYTRAKHPSGMVHLHLNLGNNYRNVKKYEVSTQWYLNGLKLATEYQLNKYIRSFNNELYINMLIKGDINKARRHQAEVDELDALLINQQVDAKIADFETKYRTLEKEREIEQLSAEKARQELVLKAEQRSKALVILFSLLMILAGALFWIWSRSKQKHKQIELAMKKAEIENRLLRVQMNPHFLFNSLNSIQSYITNNRNELAEEYLSQFAQLMRMILNHSCSDFVTFADEVQIITTYLELEKQRFNNSFDFEISIDKNIDEDSIYVPPMLVQPFVENAILHGVSPLKQGGRIEISFREQSDQTLVCTVKDNGIGRQASAKISKGSKHKSLGLQVTKERMQLIEKQTGIPLSITTVDLYTDEGESCGTCVEICIPYVPASKVKS